MVGMSIDCRLFVKWYFLKPDDGSPKFCFNIHVISFVENKKWQNLTLLLLSPPPIKNVSLKNLHYKI